MIYFYVKNDYYVCLMAKDNFYSMELVFGKDDKFKIKSKAIQTGKYVYKSYEDFDLEWKARIVFTQSITALSINFNSTTNVDILDLESPIIEDWVTNHNIKNLGLYLSGTSITYIAKDRRIDIDYIIDFDNLYYKLYNINEELVYLKTTYPSINKLFVNTHFYLGQITKGSLENYYNTWLYLYTGQYERLNLFYTYNDLVKNFMGHTLLDVNIFMNSKEPISTTILLMDNQVVKVCLTEDMLNNILCSKSIITFDEEVIIKIKSLQAKAILLNKSIKINIFVDNQFRLLDFVFVKDI